MRRYSRDELIQMLTSALGRQKAEEAVAGVGKGMGDSLTREQALQVLEALAQTPGLVGVTARFAKSRLILDRT